MTDAFPACLSVVFSGDRSCCVLGHPSSLQHCTTCGDSCMCARVCTLMVPPASLTLDAVFTRAICACLRRVWLEVVLHSIRRVRWVAVLGYTNIVDITPNFISNMAHSTYLLYIPICLWFVHCCAYVVATLIHSCLNVLVSLLASTQHISDVQAGSLDHWL